MEAIGQESVLVGQMRANHMFHSRTDLEYRCKVYGNTGKITAKRCKLKYFYFAAFREEPLVVGLIISSVLTRGKDTWKFKV